MEGLRVRLRAGWDLPMDSTVARELGILFYTVIMPHAKALRFTIADAEGFEAEVVAAGSPLLPASEAVRVLEDAVRELGLRRIRVEVARP